jgi:hypothetical protein
VHSLLHTSKMHFPIQVGEISQQQVQYTTVITPYLWFYLSLIIALLSGAHHNPLSLHFVSSKMYIMTRIFSKWRIPNTSFNEHVIAI